MKKQTAQHLDRIAAYIRETREGDVSLADVVGLAEVTVTSLKGFFEAIDKSVYTELASIADFISTMKTEIGRLQPNDLKATRIPAAGQELDAIIKSTEKATDQIMGAAEAVMSAEIDEPAAYKAFVDAKMMEIFEACSFQDLTGQRVSKVVDTLKHIEARVSRFAEAIHAADQAGYVDDDERARAERKERLLLNGPQLAGNGVQQDDVDALFGGPKPSGQDDIDKLFA